MPLESTMLCLDNSEWTRNGDYTPSRLGAFHDAANLVSGRRINPPMHPESTVGIMTIAGRVQVRCTPTRDQSRLLSATENMESGGKAQVWHGVKIAMLALKHRQNKNGAQRIVLMMGSPLEIKDEKEVKKLVKLGKDLKKNGVALDVVLIGADDADGENTTEETLSKMVKAADKDNNSHMIVVPPGVLPSNILQTSHLCVEGGGMPGTGGAAVGGGAAGGGGGGGFDEYGGIDPNLDPEMAAVMRMSLMEERARQQKAMEDGIAASQDGPATEGKEGETPAPAAAPAATAAAAAVASAEDAEPTEEELLQQAFAMSMADAGGDDDDDAALAAALALSQQEAVDSANAAPAPAPAPAVPPPIPSATPVAPAAGSAPPLPAPGVEFNDPSFVQGLLAGLPGVDTSDPRIQEALNLVNNPGGEEGKKKEEDKK